MPDTKFRLKNIIQSIANDVRIGFLVRPLLLALVLGGLGMYLSTLEYTYPQLSHWIPTFLFPITSDPAVAQIIFSNIATAMMTVVSIVFAILLMTLTLASTQYSPRIIISFVRDRVTQQTLGIFLGTFLYCLAALPSAHISPTPFCPVASVFGAMILALACVSWLLFFIIHISRAVSVNHIVHRIARETEEMILIMMPEKSAGSTSETIVPQHSHPEGAVVLSVISGYVRSINSEKLLRIAQSNGLAISVVRRVGHFVPEGIPLLSVSGGEKINSKLKKSLLGAFDIGPTRTLDQDIEFGILQIVDIGLKAVSPAINDPSTAITCVDQLCSILIIFAAHKAPQSVFYEPNGTIRLNIPRLGFDRILESAYEQIRLYSQSDVAVSLRLLRAFTDIASTLPDQNSRKLIVEQGRRLVAGCSVKLSEEVLKEMHSRLASLEKLAWLEN